MFIKKSQFMLERLNIKLPKDSSKSKELKIIDKSETQNTEEKLTFAIDANAEAYSLSSPLMSEMRSFRRSSPVAELSPVYE